MTAVTVAALLRGNNPSFTSSSRDRRKKYAVLMQISSGLYMTKMIGTLLRHLMLSRDLCRNLWCLSCSGEGLSSSFATSNSHRSRHRVNLALETTVVWVSNRVRRGFELPSAHARGSTGGGARCFVNQALPPTKLISKYKKRRLHWRHRVGLVLTQCL